MNVLSMQVLDIVLVLPDGRERRVGQAKRAVPGEPWDACLYAGVFEGYLSDALDAQDVAQLRLEFRTL